MGYNIVLRLEGDEAKAVEAFRLLTVAQQKSELASMKLEQQSKRTSTAAGGVKDALAGIGQHLGGLLSITTAMASLKRVIDEMKIERLQGLALGQGSYKAYAPFAQLAQTPGAMERMISDARLSRAETGMSAEDAANLQFQLESLGLGAERKRFAGLYPGADPASLAMGAQTMIEAMGAREVGTPIAAASKILAASQASKTTAAEFAPAASEAAKLFSLVKATDEELLSALSVISKSLKSANVAGTELKAIASTIYEKGFGGTGLWGGMTQLTQATAGMAPAQLKKYFGREESLNAWLALRDKEGEIRALEQTLTAEQGKAPDDSFMAKVAAMKRAPTMAPYAALDEIKAAAEIAQERAYGASAAERETRRAEIARWKYTQVARGEMGLLDETITTAGQLAARATMLGPPVTAARSIRGTMGAARIPWTNVDVDATPIAAVASKIEKLVDVLTQRSWNERRDPSMPDPRSRAALGGQLEDVRGMMTNEQWHSVRAARAGGLPINVNVHNGDTYGWELDVTKLPGDAAFLQAP